MAKLIETIAVVKISKLVKDNEVTKELFDSDVITNLEAVLEELVGDPTSIIEITMPDVG